MIRLVLTEPLYVGMWFEVLFFLLGAVDNGVYGGVDSCQTKVVLA
jgi:hypothetical protein